MTCRMMLCRDSIRTSLLNIEVEVSTPAVFGTIVEF